MVGLDNNMNRYSDFDKNFHLDFHEKIMKVQGSWKGMRYVHLSVCSIYSDGRFKA